LIGDHRFYAWPGHQPVADLIAAHDGEQLAVEYAQLLAQHPSRNKQGFNDGGQVWISRDEFSNSSLEFDRADNADLEPEVACAGSRHK
jgi:hypothetical protein